MAKVLAPQRTLSDQPLSGGVKSGNYVAGNIFDSELRGSFGEIFTGKTLRGIKSVQKMKWSPDTNLSARKSVLDSMTQYKKQYWDWWQGLTPADKSVYSRICRYASHEGEKQSALSNYFRRNFYYSGFDLFCRVAQVLGTNPIPVVLGQGGVEVLGEFFEGEGTEFTSKQWSPYEERPCTSTYTKIYVYQVKTLWPAVFLQFQYDVAPNLGSCWIDVYEHTLTGQFIRAYKPVVKIGGKYNTFVQHVKQTFFFSVKDRILTIKIKPNYTEGTEYWDFGEIISYSIGG